MKSGSKDGFTLIEMAVVAAISGLVMSIALLVYRSYMNDRFANETYEKLRAVDSSLAFFINTAGRLPCPSNPTIPVDDPNAGREIPAGSCQTLRAPATAAGTCIDGVCRVDGARDTDSDSISDPVLIGGLPFRTFREKDALDPTKDLGSTKSLSHEESLDPWGYQLTYAVSGYLTAQASYSASAGAIDVRTEPTAAIPGGTSLVDPAGSSQYVVVGHGQNHIGAYSSQGVIGLPCTPGVTQDSDNCDGDSSFTSGLLRLSADTSYFDDILIYNSYALSTLWDFVGTTTDIYNRNPGFVGVGTATPLQKLQVVGDIQADTATMAQLCSRVGTACWSPDFLAAPAGSGMELSCPNTNVPGMVDVVIGIKLDPVTNQPVADCGLASQLTPLPNQQCGTGLFVLGFGPGGSLVCGTP